MNGITSRPHIVARSGGWTCEGTGGTAHEPFHDIAIALIFLATPLLARDDPTAKTDTPPLAPKSVKTVPIKRECDPGWTLVLAESGRPMCARELKEPNQR